MLRYAVPIAAVEFVAYEELSCLGGSFYLLGLSVRSRKISLVAMFLLFETFVRSSKPNNYLVAPDGLCRNSTPDAASPLINEMPSEVISALISHFESEKGWRDLEYDVENHRISVVAVTSLMRFKDDLDILAIPEGENTQIAIYSRSRVGHSDLGANRKRVSVLLELILGE